MKAIMAVATCNGHSPYARNMEFQFQKTTFQYLGECYRILRDAISTSRISEILYTCAILIQHVIWNLDGESLESRSIHIFGLCQALKTAKTSSFLVSSEEFRKLLEICLKGLATFLPRLLIDCRSLGCDVKINLVCSALDQLTELLNAYPLQILVSDTDPLYSLAVSLVSDYLLYLHVSELHGRSAFQRAFLEPYVRLQSWLRNATKTFLWVTKAFLDSIQNTSISDCLDPKVAPFIPFELAKSAFVFSKAALVYEMLYEEHLSDSSGGAKTAAKGLLIFLSSTVYRPFGMPPRWVWLFVGAFLVRESEGTPSPKCITHRTRCNAIPRRPYPQYG
jgi:hypothetical protein